MKLQKPVSILLLILSLVSSCRYIATSDMGYANFAGINLVLSILINKEGQ